MNTQKKAKTKFRYFDEEIKENLKYIVEKENGFIGQKENDVNRRKIEEKDMIEYDEDSINLLSNIYDKEEKYLNINEDNIKEKEDEEDVFRILLCTDSHLGFKENDSNRCDDSFNAFYEILKIAKNKKVDFILHSGDLFDQHQPSRDTMYKTMKMLREFCFGGGEIKFEVLNQENYFKFGKTNFENENLNIDLPIFVIHGNHDDPGGESRLSPIDVLEAANLINYFGRTDDLEDIEVSPILMRKGKTNLSIYGIGWIKDERLHRAFQNEKVKFLVPEENGFQNRFNILLIHQNRYKGALGGMPTKNNICDKMLPSFLDLVIWGHEHECLIDGYESIEGSFWIVQPGSSVHTSLSSGETLNKHVALLEIKGDSFRIIPIELLSVRPFEFEDVCLAEENLSSNDEKEVWNFLTQMTENLIDRAKQEFIKKKMKYQNENLVEQLPLIRLRVNNDKGFLSVANWRFGHQFTGRVANANEILHFYQKKKKES